MHIKRIHEMVEKLTEGAKCEVDKGLKQINGKEMGEVTDMIKDLCEAEYYAKIVKAMEEEEKEEEFESRMYYPRRRDSRGRFMSNRGGRSGRYGYEEPPYMHMPLDGMDMGAYRSMHNMTGTDWDRDMDMKDGRLYYDGQSSGRGMGGGSQDRDGKRSSSRYGFSHDEYLEKRKEHPATDPEHKRKRMELLDEYLEDLCDSAKEVVEGMTPEEKQMWKSKITKILNM